MTLANNLSYRVKREFVMLMPYRTPAGYFFTVRLPECISHLRAQLRRYTYNKSRMAFTRRLAGMTGFEPTFFVVRTILESWVWRVFFRIIISLVLFISSCGSSHKPTAATILPPHIDLSASRRISLPHFLFSHYDPES